MLQLCIQGCQNQHDLKNLHIKEIYEFNADKLFNSWQLLNFIKKPLLEHSICK